MNIETVNELIQSLESAGELSIKESKYLELAKAYQQLAAENVALKQAESNLVRNIINDLGDTEFQYARVHTPATDRIYAGIKADGLNAFISHYSAELDAHIANGGDQFDATSIRLRGFIVGGRMFREKLREGDKA